MENLNKLTKQIDALTYNARNVVNALIRSTVTSGSYNGYTVTRVGNEITLSRVDIYRLYTFYQEWEYHYSFDSDSFDELVSVHDEKYLRTDGTIESMTSAALVKHAKILYLSSENVGEIDNDEFWLAKIRDNANPKQVTNSCPIPLNLRTPIYDENLSTKHFSQFESYLFPTGYHSMGLLGYMGDDTDHVGGGKSWVFDVDDSFNVNASKIVLGYHEPERRAVKERSYDSSKAIHSLMSGIDCYAYSDGSFAGGRASYSLGEVSFTYGYKNFSNAPYSAIVGGDMNITTGYDSFIGGGSGNTVAADRGFAANYGASVGGGRYKFTKKMNSGSDSDITECAAQPDVVIDGCTYELIAKNATTGSASNTVTLSPNVIYIRAVDIAKTYNTTSLDDIKVGDEVVLYAFSTRVDNVNSEYYNNSSRVTKSITAFVDDISTDGTGNDLNYVITLDTKVVMDDFDITGGYITLKTAYRSIATMGSGILQIHSGTNSTALNKYTRAVGIDQTVVGSYNVPMYEPKFIVGGGFSEVSSSFYRYENGNTLVSGPRYSYLSDSTGCIYSGLSSHSNHTDPYLFKNSDDSRSAYILDENSDGSISYMNGLFGIAWRDTAHSTAGILNVRSDFARLTVGGTRGTSGNDMAGIMMRDLSVAGAIPQMFDSEHVQLMAGGKNGVTLLYSGEIDNEIIDYADGSVSDGMSNNVVIAADGRLSLKFGNTVGCLKLSGNTYGALPTNASSLSHGIINSSTNVLSIDDLPSGFYYTNTGHTNPYDSELVNLPRHIFASTYKTENGLGQSSAAIIVPNSAPADSAVPHVRVVADLNGAEVLNERLAYMSDVASATTVVNGAAMIPTNVTVSGFTDPMSKIGRVYYTKDNAIVPNTDLGVSTTDRRICRPQYGSYDTTTNQYYMSMWYDDGTMNGPNQDDQVVRSLVCALNGNMFTLSGAINLDPFPDTGTTNYKSDFSSAFKNNKYNSIIFNVLPSFRVDSNLICANPSQYYTITGGMISIDGYICGTAKVKFLSSGMLSVRLLIDTAAAKKHAWHTGWYADVNIIGTTPFKCATGYTGDRMNTQPDIRKYWSTLVNKEGAVYWNEDMVKLQWGVDNG